MANVTDVTDYRCQGCGEDFATRQQLGGHLSKGFVCNPNVITEPIVMTAPATTAIITAPIAVPLNVDFHTYDVAAPVPAATQLSLVALIQRPTQAYANHHIEPAGIHPSNMEFDERTVHKLNEVIPHNHICFLLGILSDVIIFIIYDVHA